MGSNYNERLRERAYQDEKAQKVVNVVSDALNSGLNKKDFAMLMSLEHRYLQGEFMLLVLEWLRVTSDEDYPTDGRNEFVAKISKEIAEHLIEKGIF